MHTDRPLMLTGVNGFCAGRLYRLLKEKGYGVMGFAHRELDITDRDACVKKLRELSPRAVIHSAAISQMPACEKDPELSNRVNVLGAENLAIACREAGARMILFSTDQVYNGVKETGPHREEGAVCQANVYGHHKKEAEKRVAAATEDYAAIRLTWMYDFPVRGLYTSSNLMTMCLSALARRTPLSLPSNSGRGITYVYEVLEQIPLLMDAPAEVYNFGSCSTISTYDAARLIFEGLGAGDQVPELLVPQEEAPGTYPDLRMDCAKAAAQGIRFSTTEEGIHRALKEYGYR